YGAMSLTATEDLILSDIMNQYTKIVVTKTLKSLTWANSYLIRGDDVLGGMAQVKRKPGKDIVVLGSSRLVSYLIKHDLIDEFHIWVHPIKIGRGKRISALNQIAVKEKPSHVEQISSGV